MGEIGRMVAMFTFSKYRNFQGTWKEVGNWVRPQNVKTNCGKIPEEYADSSDCLWWLIQLKKKKKQTTKKLNITF